MPIDFSKRVQPPTDVLVQVLQDEAVVLSLRNGHYYGLNPTATRMWQSATNAENLGLACQALQDEFDVSPDRLRQDLENFVLEMLTRGLLEWHE